MISQLIGVLLTRTIEQVDKGQSESECEFVIEATFGKSCTSLRTLFVALLSLIGRLHSLQYRTHPSPVSGCSSSN